MKKIETIVGLFLLLGAIAFNLWLYRVEPTAKVDPNDNAFQFALVDRTNTMWDFATKRCSSGITILVFPLCHASYMVDHWVPNWAEGYNLPFYYSHFPQIAIVASYRFFAMMVSSLSLFTYYHIVIYLLLCLFPLSVFAALRILGISPLTAGIGAVFATHLSTDGLYGLDPASFLWRGYGLSSQLFAMIFLPQAIAFTLKFFSSLPWSIDTLSSVARIKQHLTSLLPFAYRKALADTTETRQTRYYFWGAVLFLLLTAAGHLGIGMIAVISLLPLALCVPLVQFLKQQTMSDVVTAAKSHAVALIVLAGVVVFFLSYWIVPIQLGDNYHNISFWDPVWKFNSYGWYEITKNLLNGDLFDFGRAPILTVLLFIGLFSAFGTNLVGLSLLFGFWLLMYFGRTTWGGIMDLIPGMKEFHLSRFIVAVHAAGLLLIPLGTEWLITYIIQWLTRVKRLNLTGQKKTIASWALTGLVLLILVPAVYGQTIKYNELNNTLIKRANANYDNAKKDNDELFATIHTLPPARIFTGRGGWWGKDFRIAETPYYMHLSTYGLPTVLWMPQTWSPNSDTEQYFSEDVPYHYDLYNMRYVATPPNQPPLRFWKPMKQTPSWKLYEVDTSGYFTVGSRNMVVATDKRSFVNVVHMWTQSPFSTLKLFPQIVFGRPPADTGVPVVRMTDEVTYKTPDGKTYNIFVQSPLYQAPPPAATLVGPETSDTDMVFKTNVKVEKDCRECLLVLKQTFHPNWRATVDGKPVTPITVFPFFTAVPLTTEGTHEVVLEYKPSTLKVLLMIVELCVLVALLFPFVKRKLHS